MSATKQTQPPVECKLDKGGDLVIARDGKEIAAISRADLNLESRMAIAAFARACAELRSVDELEPNEKVVAAANCMVRDPLSGLPFGVMRGQELDNPRIIEQVLAIREPEPIRLLRKGGELEIESMLRELLTVKGQEGLAQSTLIQKRTLAAAQGV